MKDTEASLLKISSFVLALGMAFPIGFALDRQSSNTESESKIPVASYDRVTSMPEYDFEIPDYNKPATEYAYMTQDWIVYYPISAEDRHVIECIVQGEAGGESLEGKMWVATCILNAMKREDGASASEIRKLYQYSGWSEDITDETISAVSRVFDDGEVMHDSVLWFYAPGLCTSSWHESQQFVAEVGGHRLFAPW